MLDNKIVMVTGASMGIGLATAKKFLSEGATVIGIGSDEDGLLSLGSNFEYIACDVTKEEEIKRTCSYVSSKYSKLDTLVTVCDKYYAGGVFDINEELLQKAFKHIVQAPMLLTKYCSEMLHNGDNPSVTHDIPVSALMMEDDYLMASLNTAIINFVRQAAPKIRPVRINAAMYGLIDGHFLSEAKKLKYTAPESKELIPAGRLGTPEDVANFNAFLASDKCRYINSAAMQIDGGLYTMNPRSMGSAI